MLSRVKILQGYDLKLQKQHNLRKTQSTVNSKEWFRSHSQAMYMRLGRTPTVT